MAKIRVTLWDDDTEYEAVRINDDGGSFHGYYETRDFIFAPYEVEVIEP